MKVFKRTNPRLKRKETHFLKDPGQARCCSANTVVICSVYSLFPFSALQRHTQLVRNGDSSYKIEKIASSVQKFQLFLDQFEFAYWWSCFVQGLHRACKAGLFFMQYKVTAQRNLANKVGSFKITFISDSCPWQNFNT